MRDPKVLEVVDEALFGRIASETSYEAGGVQDRVWKVRARPLSGADGQRLALLTLRDETELRRSERTRADFLANASHELRTPLASLTGFIETLRGHAKDDAKARDRFLGIMQDQAERMARLIEDLMSLSRIELNEHIPPSGRADLRLAVPRRARRAGADGRPARPSASTSACPMRRRWPDRRSRPDRAGDPEPRRERR